MGTDIKVNVPTTTYNRKLLMSVGGIMGFFLLYGVLQEKIMNYPYGEDDNGEPIYFTDSTFIVLSNRVCAAIIAVIIVVYRGESLRNVAPLHKYFGVALSNFCATWCQYEALKYVNFPTQTLGKCGKMMPVMLVGTFISGKKYSLKDYLIAVTITMGCMIFFMTGDIASKNSENTMGGLLLMAAYMFFDSFTSTFQEKMFKGYTMSTYDQMIYVNSCSALISVLILLFNGRLFPAIDFAMTYSQLLTDSTFLSICASLGQMVIYFTIKEFGALIFSTIMVTRQVFSIVLSTFLFIHPLSPFQWIGALIVFGTLYYKAIEDQKNRKHGHGHSKSEDTNNKDKEAITVTVQSSSSNNDNEDSNK
ncbi:hypothetical protein DFA_03139 [Cavenderia fasciculata]|uniref:Uncharacterized protein n=1 Tax=Cavenderia fasciculata TaxID=261658 RepID=F4PGR0_CACFS|nr:uncharacterized protein DFA_03139 [Cavenderia fasciculata]EGG24894.1 hypothetical protein DFA_03139 [Cavenderia fasciculata]|eukprot:XP_004362745.1 hypothetical protein DFA_03139 [Cavenderia fasciculata]